MLTLAKIDEAWRRIAEAIFGRRSNRGKNFWGQGQSHRREIALMSPEPDAAKAEAHFERALALRVNNKRSPGSYAPQ